jgi:hypothetical protein
LCRPLVPSIFVVVPQCGRTLGGARPGSRSHDGMALGGSVMARGLSNASGATSNPPISPGESTRLTFVSKAAGVIFIGRLIRQVRQSISCCRPSVTRIALNGCCAKRCGIGGIHSLVSLTRIWHPSTLWRSGLLRRKEFSAAAAGTAGAVFEQYHRARPPRHQTTSEGQAGIPSVPRGAPNDSGI